ncbi:MAG: LysM peptidoglycan-binding domain-containing protein [Chloroflexi bacterium]|nr:LysM peptidoglycan-binding domain-containing protein [Chloroflexota bacterium]
MLRKRLWIFGLIIMLTACSRPWTETSVITPASVWTSGQVPTAVAVTPTISYTLPTPRPPGAPVLTPTPDVPHYQTGVARGPETYIVQSGDWLSAIAERYSVSVEAIIQANNISNPDALEVGQRLTIPVVTPQAPGPATKLIPDSELVYGPLSASFDIAAFIHSKGGYLASYTQDVNGETLDATQVVQLIAQNYSVNPRLLLAVLESRSGWVTNPNPDPTMGDTPFGYIDSWYVGLYRQLAWASIHLNSGFYRWRANSVTDWVLGDGSVVPIDPTINAGTAGVQNFFARLDDYSSWLRDVSPGGFFDTYYLLFGYPFDTAIEPLVPANLAQPLLLLPFGPGETWAFTGGPHPAWDAGSPYGALDFAPAETRGCVETNLWVTAVADGLVTRTGNGVVMLDLDGDGSEGTGWVILYMHIESRDRVQPGTFLRAGEPVGHPSCEGGISNGTHVHLARKFNGVWMPADGPVPLNLSGWVASGTGEEYVGTLTRNGVVVESYDDISPINQIQR